MPVVGLYWCASVNSIPTDITGNLRIPPVYQSYTIKYHYIPLYTNCIPTVYQLYTNCIPTVYQLYTNCIPIVYQLYTVYHLYTNCIPIVYHYIPLYTVVCHRIPLYTVIYRHTPHSLAIHPFSLGKSFSNSASLHVSQSEKSEFGFENLYPRIFEDTFSTKKVSGEKSLKINSANKSLSEKNLKRYPDILAKHFLNKKYTQ